MNCQRCQANKTRYRVYSDIINLIVCTSCAKNARRLGLADELPRRKQRGIRYRITDFFDAASGGEFDPCWIEPPPRLRTDHQPGNVLDCDLPLNSAA